MKWLIYVLMLVFVFSSFTYAWDNDDVVWYWELGDGSNVTENISQIYNATPINQVWSVANSSGHPNSAFRLTDNGGFGNNRLDMGDVPDYFLTSSNMTLCFYANFSSIAPAGESVIKNQAGLQHDFFMRPDGNGDKMQIVFDNGIGSFSDIESTTVVTDDLWRTYCVVTNLNTGNITLYVNGTNEDGNTDWDGFSGGTGSLLFQNPTQYMTIDKIVFFNLTMNETDIAKYNTGFQIIGEPGPAGIANVYGLLYDDDWVLIPGVIEEDEEFYIFANYSIDGTPTSGATCNFTANNITAHFSYESATDIDLDGNTDSLTLIVSESGGVSDIIEFEICEVSSPVNAEVYIDGVLHETITSTSIPVCPSVHTELNFTKEYIADNNINLTLQCVGCNNVNRQLRVVSDFQGDVMHFERTYGNGHQETMVYNATSTLYEYRGHKYEYLVSGSDVARINTSCDSTLNESIRAVQAVLPTINITTINDIVYTDGIQVEAINQTNITIDVFGDVIEKISFNVTYENGTVIKESFTTSMSLSVSELDHNGIYNISINATDNDDSHTFLSGFFRYNDTLGPSITWLNPLEDNSTSHIVDTNFQLELTFSDNISIWGWWVWVTGPDGKRFVYYNDTGLDVQEVNIFQVFTPNLTGTWSVNVTVNDSFDGSSNTKNEIILFSVETTAPVNTTLPFNECPDTIEGQMALWTIVFLILFFIFIGFMFKLPGIGILSSIGLLFIAFTVSGCSGVIALVLGGISLVLIGYYVFAKT